MCGPPIACCDADLTRHEQHLHVHKEQIKHEHTTEAYVRMWQKEMYGVALVLLLLSL